MSDKTRPAERMIALSRRDLLKASAILAAAGLGGTMLPAVGRADEVASLSVGDFTVYSLSDGHLQLPVSMLAPEAPQEEVVKLLAAAGLPTDEHLPPCNVTLAVRGDDRILFDVGAGANFMASSGQLLDSLEAAGFGPEDITHVLFTHAHPDHLWGVLDDFDDPLFADAVHMIAKPEIDFWMSEEAERVLPEERLAFMAGARRYLGAIEDLLETFEPGAEVTAGVQAVATHGHTPGHTSFELRSGTESAMVLGDAVLHPAISFAHPGWRSGSDQDPDGGIAARTMLLGRLADEQMPFVGYHLPGGIGRAERKDGAFRFVAG